MDHPPETTSLLHHFTALKDPRERVKVVFPLPEIVLLVLCATIVGADDFVEINHWGKIHIAFLRRFLPYKHGIPSHDVSIRRGPPSRAEWAFDLNGASTNGAKGLLINNRIGMAGLPIWDSQAGSELIESRRD
jgi:hypothetical protein